MDTIRAKIGATRRVKLTLDAGTYTGAEALAAAVWPGDDRATLFAPSVAWLDPDDRTMTLEWAAADTADLDPGRYRLELSVSAGGATTKLDVAWVELLVTPGSGTAPAVYASAEDLRRVAPWLEALQGEHEQAGFAEARGEAREWLEGVIHAHHRGTSHAGVGWPGYLPAGGGATLGRSAWLAEQLAADALVVTAQVRRCVSLYAAAVVMQPQLGLKADNGQSYRDLAREFRAEAESLARTLVVELDTDADGVGEVAIDLGTIRVVRG